MVRARRVVLFCCHNKLVFFLSRSFSQLRNIFVVFHFYVLAKLKTEIILNFFDHISPFIRTTAGVIITVLIGGVYVATLTMNARFRTPAENFPKTLKEFGYKFNDRGQLRKIDDGSRFVFEAIPGNFSYNQKRYEALGEAISEEIYQLLERRLNLKKHFIPIDAKRGEASGFFFASENAFTAERVLILIHGGGQVRAGQWSRKLIINVDLDTGSQIPYIEDGLAAGYGVVVLNTNLYQTVDSTGRMVHIRGSEDPTNHAIYVWDNFVETSNAKYIAIVAHSAGGCVTVDLADERHKSFCKRVVAVAFTDSGHFKTPASPAWLHLMKVASNWVPSQNPVGIKIPRESDDINCISAGPVLHEETSAVAKNDITKYMAKRITEAKDAQVRQRPPSEEAQAVEPLMDMYSKEDHRRMWLRYPKLMRYIFGHP